MSTPRVPLRQPLLLALLLATTGAGAAVVRVEGELQEFGLPAEGRYDLQLQPYATADASKALQPATELLGVEVRNGRFEVELDLPGGLPNDPSVAIAVRAHGEAAGYAALPVRVQAKAGPIGVCWSTTGDQGVTPGTHFLGTTDAQPLELRTNNAPFLVAQPGTDGISPNILMGHSTNQIVEGNGVVIGGGGAPSNANIAEGNFATIAGGGSNRATAIAATVAGGLLNQATAPASSVLGGEGNFATSASSTVGGGEFNVASGAQSVVAGGGTNRASGIRGAVLGGNQNTASGLHSSVVGGFGNCAGGTGSLAVGMRAKVRPGSGSASAGVGCNGVALAPLASGDAGTFVWADSRDADFVSSGADQFLVRARGGMALNSSTLPSGIDLFLVSRQTNNAFDLLMAAEGAASAVLLSSVAGSLAVAGANLGNPQSPTYTNYAQWNGAGQFRLFVDNPIKPTSGGFSAASDARLKTAVRPLDGALDALLQLEGVRFRYRADAPDGLGAPGEQTGFIAQQVEQVFPDWVIEHESGFKLVGSKGFEALTVEALRELRAEKDAEIAELREQNAQLAARLARLERVLERAD